MISDEARRLIGDRPRAIEKTVRVCGFLDRAPDHTASFTTGSGTYCSTCHLRIYNEAFDGKFEIVQASVEDSLVVCEECRSTHGVHLVTCSKFRKCENCGTPLLGEIVPLNQTECSICRKPEVGSVGQGEPMPTYEEFKQAWTPERDLGKARESKAEAQPEAGAVTPLTDADLLDIYMGQDDRGSFTVSRQCRQLVTEYRALKSASVAPSVEPGLLNLHGVICDAVALMNRGNNMDAHTLLRKALVACADREVAPSVEELEEAAKSALRLLEDMDCGLYLPFRAEVKKAIEALRAALGRKESR